MRPASKLLCLLLSVLLLVTGCTYGDPAGNCVHTDDNDDGKCDECLVSVMVAIDIYAINDLHGKFDDTDNSEGVDELTTYLKHARAKNRNTVILSSGDMWQGSSESNLTKGLLMTEWMSELGFASMTLGNHEFDWGEDQVAQNSVFSSFPFLAINVYERSDNTLADYCSPSVLLELDGVDVGIIGAIGDCYSSISSDKTEEIYFKVGDELTELVKAEAQKLRSRGAEIIIYSLHDGYGLNKNGTFPVSDKDIASYYDIELSSYVDVVFEGHTHKSYVLKDSMGVYHVQGGGDGDGLSHAKLLLNSVTYTVRMSRAEVVESYEYEHLDDDPLVDLLLQKYADDISLGYESLGNNIKKRNSDELCDLVASLYFQKGCERWGDEYTIILGGGYVSARSPYHIPSGEVKYNDIQSVFPFDNELVLCSVKGSDMKNKFIETSNSNYHVSYATAPVIDPNATYYIVTDTYTSTYAPNRLTEIERFGEGVYARDLIAEYVRAGGFEK